MVGADTGDVDDFYEGGEIMSLVQPHMLTSYNYECNTLTVIYFIFIAITLFQMGLPRRHSHRPF